MDTQFIISIIILFTLLEVFAVILFIMYKQGKIDENPFTTVLKKEWLILFYTFFRWKNRQGNSSAKLFHYHKGSLYFWLLIALLHEQVIEAIVFNIYLKDTDPLRADILLILHVYSILYMLGDYNWVRNSPIKIIKRKVHMKIGARRSLIFHVKDVKTVQPTRIQYTKNGMMIREKNAFHVAALPRVLTRIFGVTDELKYEIVFKEPLQARGYFGQKKAVNKALIYMDEPQNFIKALEAEIEEYKDQGEIEADSFTDNLKETKEPLINWKIYFFLLFLNVLGAIAISPYAIAREQLHEVMGLSKWTFTMLYIVQILLEAGVFLFISLLIGKKVGIKIPIIESLFNKGRMIKNLGRKIYQSAFYGVLTGLVIIAFSLIVSEPLGVDNSSIKEPAWWLGVLGSFGAAVNEESIFRLFIVTFILWLFLKIKKRKITRLHMYLAISFSALVFGVMHYSMASSNFEMTIEIFVSMLIINGIGGLVFGALFLYVGLEFAIIAHFTADITLHVIGPFLVKVF
ncbi:CPBP family intramembrane glutamic endopeptidase [Fictibacillus phosphorivorans]|uniref:CPBP family intramembrane glutamic endopeptidase n=1 Tax=Fictibacillus phosphorivorans TaxID=1221500 RepID=UPI003CE8A47A